MVKKITRLIFIYCLSLLITLLLQAPKQEANIQILGVDTAEINSINK